MNRFSPQRIIIVLTVIGVPAAAPGQNGNGLLLPFPVEAAAEASPHHQGPPVPERNSTSADEPKRGDSRRARELAETFIRRQQMEVANSVPRRGKKQVTVPSRTATGRDHGGRAITGATNVAGFDTAGFGSTGPASELLPLPDDESPGALTDSLLPDASEVLSAGGPHTETSLAVDSMNSEVPRNDLAPAPAYGGVEDQDRRGPVFRIDGAQAFAVARARGFKFTPAGGIGSRDGAHTASSQFPNLLTSEVHGTRMSQLRPPVAWSVTETSNTFFMFCDANYNAVRLAPGWRIRGIKLEGPHWRWVACPRSGANTASFSIRVHSYKGQDAPTTVQLAGLTLEGPVGAADWREAFPLINGKSPSPQPAAGPPVTAEYEAGIPTPGLDRGDEPPLPQ